MWAMLLLRSLSNCELPTKNRRYYQQWSSTKQLKTKQHTHHIIKLIEIDLNTHRYIHIYVYTYGSTFGASHLMWIGRKQCELVDSITHIISSYTQITANIRNSLGLCVISLLFVVVLLLRLLFYFGFSSPDWYDDFLPSSVIVFQSFDCNVQNRMCESLHFVHCWKKILQNFVRMLIRTYWFGIITSISANHNLLWSQFQCQKRTKPKIKNSCKKITKRTPNRDNFECAWK